MSGTLFVVATPIGNLGDITFRAVETLKSVAYIACEDTRHTLGLLRHLGIDKPLLRYDDHSHHQSVRRILSLLGSGQSVALVSDAGTPAISDPGRRLAKEVRLAGHRVVPIPGPSSLITALSAAGLDDEGFVFLGFLPRKKGPAVRLLREALRLGKTLVVLESPFRLVSTLLMIEEEQLPVEVVVARELTKFHEEFVYGSAKMVREQLEKRDKLGECVVLLQERNIP